MGRLSEGIWAYARIRQALLLQEVQDDESVQTKEQILNQFNRLYEFTPKFNAKAYLKRIYDEIENKDLTKITVKELKETLYSTYGFNKIWVQIIKKGKLNTYRKELTTKLEKEAIKQVREL